MPKAIGLLFFVATLLQTGLAQVSPLTLEGVYMGELPEGCVPSTWKKPSRIHWVGSSLREVWFQAKIRISNHTFLYIPSVDHEIALYKDKHLIYSFGNRKEFLFSFFPIIISLTNDSFTSLSEEAFLIRIRSDTAFLGFPRLPILVGNLSDILQLLVRRDITLWVMVALILFSALASLVTFYWYSKKFIGWLFGFALTLAIYLFTRSLAKWWIFGLHPRLYGFLELWSLFFIPFFIWQMIRGILSLSKRWHTFLSYILFGFGCVTVIGSLFSFNVLAFVLYPFEVFLMFFLPVLLSLIFYHRKTNPWAREVFGGFLVLGITALLDILREQGIIMSQHIFTSYGWVAVFVNFLVVETRKMRSMVRANNQMIQEIHNLNIELRSTQKEIILRLSEIAEARSRETGNHVRRVSEYAVIIAKKCGLSPEEIELLKLAVPMHDLGKLAIPDAILHKPGKLTEEEFELMKKHTIFGHDMLCKSSGEIFKTAAIIALEHHERIDGNGYPHRKKGNNIHLYARITTVADVFDSLSSDRCYKKAWPWDQVVRYMKENSGSQFEPRLVEYLLSAEEEIRQIQHTYFDNFQGE